MGKLISISHLSVKYKAIARTQQIEINRETGDRRHSIHLPLNLTNSDYLCFV